MTEDILDQPIIDEISDRRLDYRVKLDVPIEVEFDSPGQQLEKRAATASQLSRRGLTLASKAVLAVNSEILVRIPVPTANFPIHSTAKIAWSASRNGSTLYGLEFTHIPRIHFPYLTRFLSRHMTARGQVQERRVKSQLISELVEFRNRRGKRIVGFHDHLITTNVSAPYLVIPAPYGETKLNSLQVAYYLANNGFNVVRFDPSDHVGESEGEHLDYTLPKLKGDILSALDYVLQKTPKTKMGIVAASLAARAAYKTVAEDSRPTVLISILGVVNTQYTLQRVQNEDLIGTYLNGKIWQMTNVLGHNVYGQQFLSECVEKKFHNLKTTIEDLREAKCPIVFLCSDNDPWVHIGDSRKAILNLPNDMREVHMISSMHCLKENPLEAKRVFRFVVSSASKYLNGTELPSDKVVEPRAREIGVQGRLEKERAKHLTEYTKQEEKDFWTGYLSRFHYIYSLPDYRNLLETILNELGSVEKNDWIFDAGCGNGNLGLWLLVKLGDLGYPIDAGSRRAFSTPSIDAPASTGYPSLGESHEKNHGSGKIVFNYIAGDIVQQALDHSRKLHADAQEALTSKLGLSRNFMVPQYLHVDMDTALPFLDDTFDKICSNLVISYLANPVFSLRELIRVLKPGGKLVITTLKKDADISQIYRNFVEYATSEVELEEAKSLLSNAGRVLEKETEGHFRFFSERELQILLNQASPASVASYRRCFVDQAIAVTITK